MLFILELDCLWESGFIQAASLDHLDEVLTLVLSLPWREREKGQLCNFENYKKEKGVQGEILWVHEVRVQIVTAISGVIICPIYIAQEPTKRKWDLLICWIFLFSVLNYIVFSGGTGCWIFVCLCTLYNLKYLVYYYIWIQNV